MQRDLPSSRMSSRTLSWDVLPQGDLRSLLHVVDAIVVPTTLLPDAALFKESHVKCSLLDLLRLLVGHCELKKASITGNDSPVVYDQLKFRRILCLTADNCAHRECTVSSWRWIDRV